MMNHLHLNASMELKKLLLGGIPPCLYSLEE